MSDWKKIGWLGMAMACVVGVVGCQSKPAPVEEEAQRRRVVVELPVAGEWSEAVGGVRCRILLDRKSVEETGVIQGSFVMENVGTQAVALGGKSDSAAAAVVWKAGGAAMLIDIKASGVMVGGGLSLAPGGTLTTEPVKMLVPPGVGVKAISASLGASAQAPGVSVQVEAAQWGTAVEGLRLRLAAARGVCAVGQRPGVHLIIHNQTSRAMAVHTPDWSSLKMEQHGDLVLLSFRTDDELCAEIQPGGLWLQPVEAPLLLAPGTYRLRLVLDSPELPAVSRPAWHGRGLTNDLPLEVRAE